MEMSNEQKLAKLEEICKDLPPEDVEALKGFADALKEGRAEEFVQDLYDSGRMNATDCKEVFGISPEVEMIKVKIMAENVNDTADHIFLYYYVDENFNYFSNSGYGDIVYMTADGTKYKLVDIDGDTELAPAELCSIVKINIPVTNDGYLAGNGEGCFCLIDVDTKEVYNNDEFGGNYSAILYNSSVYYKGLEPGEVIPFTMRGDKRPVADLDYLQKNFELSEER